MARYIIIDAFTGYIWGDTATFTAHPKGQPQDIVEACRLLDESIGGPDRTYEAVSRLDGDSGYFVYDACANGAEVIGEIGDGQDQEAIDEVVEKCRLVGCVQYTISPDLGPHDEPAA